MGCARDRVLGAIHETEVEVESGTDVEKGGQEREGGGSQDCQHTLAEHSMAKGPYDLSFNLDLDQFQQDLFDVQDALERASVDARERKIIWHDDTRLSIEEAARIIRSESGVPVDIVQFHVVCWLQTHYEPEGLDQEQMEEFEQMIERWTAPYEDLN